MISFIPHIHKSNNVITNNPKRMAFRGVSADCVELTTRKKGTPEMGNDKYEQVNKSFNKDEETQLFSKKIRHLPMIMDGIMRVVREYLQNNLSSNTFSETFIDRTPFLAKRIEFAPDGKEYAKNYQEEIDFIKSLNPVCAEYCDDKTDKITLDSTVEDLVAEYNAKPERQRKHYIK